ncbi:MAG TPA: hypothetical protein PKD52_10945 [Clostridiales bacterium]|nr:hypothetical protein [Clostridiales bacterium]
MRITTPIPASDNIGKVVPNKETPAVIPTDPAKVTTRNQNDQSGQKNSLDLTWDNRSVFQKFTSQLQQTPGLAQTLQKLLLSTMTHQNAANTASPLNALLTQLANSTKMSKQEIIDNLVFQQKHSTKFSGELFQIFRHLMKANGSPELRDHLGQFIKSYDGFTSANETMSAIFAQLKEIMAYIPQSYRQELEQQMSFLPTVTDQEAIKSSLFLLKEKILPLLGKYISAFNDFGEIRGKVSLLMHNVSRLNVGSPEELISRFEELMGYCQYKTNISATELTRLRLLFMESIDQPQQLKNDFLDALIKALFASNQENTSSTRQTMLIDTVNTILLNNSVYMPFTHLFLPIQYNGAFLFSEIWIEKQEERENGKSTESHKKPVNLYLAFDIEGLGHFKMAIAWDDHKVNCKLNYPDQLKNDDYTIRRDITKIFAENGFLAESINTTSDLSPFAEILMKKVYERKREVDVTI